MMPTGPRFVTQVASSDGWETRRRCRARGEAEAEARATARDEERSTRVVRSSQDGTEEVVVSFPAPGQALSIVERSELTECETVIERGQRTFVEVGNALARIRDGRLYRASHGTFEDYCQERWGFSRQYANRVIGASAVTEHLETIVSKPPATETQARPLIGLEPEQQREAWKEAVETAPGGKVTAAHVEEVVTRRYTPANGHSTSSEKSNGEVSEIHHRCREVADEFCRNLAIDLAPEYPALLHRTWVEIEGKLRKRLLRVLSPYKLISKGDRK